MRIVKMFCSGCDRDVSVVSTDAISEEHQANIPEPELVCLEVGAWCTGSLCPLGAAEPNAMISRMIKNGLSLDHLETTKGFCAACNAEREMALYGRMMAACLVCGTTGALQA